MCNDQEGNEYIFWQTTGGLIYGGLIQAYGDNAKDFLTIVPTYNATIGTKVSIAKVLSLCQH